MSHLFTVLPFEVNNPQLPVIPESDIERLVVVEPGAYDLWQFGNSSASLRGLQNSRTMVAQSDQPTFSENYLTLSAGVGKALLSGLAETAALQDTICGVFRMPAVGASAFVFMGSLEPSSAGGGGLFLTTPNLVAHNQRGKTNLSQATGLTNTAGQWVFFAMSRDFVDTGNVVVMAGGQAAFVDQVDGVYVPAALPIGIGNSGYTSGHSTNEFDCAELAIFEKALTVEQLQNVYLRSKSRMAQRGITVL